jgi:hypothetical protein
MADEITGRDLWIITEALATALVALEQLPAERQPTGNIEDMKKLLAHAASGNPDLDPMTVYRSYGISGPDDE